jgi:hypothetical protein
MHPITITGTFSKVLIPNFTGKCRNIRGIAWNITYLASVVKSKMVAKMVANMVVNMAVDFQMAIIWLFAS